MNEENEESSFLPPLYSAVFSSDLAELRALLRAGAKPDEERVDDGHTALHCAAENGNLAAVHLLLAAGCQASLNGFDYISHTPLMWAAKKGALEVARALIEAGADLNAHDAEKSGNNAIKEAVEASDLAMVKLLLEAGADPTLRGWMWHTAMTKAKDLAEKSKPGSARAQILELLTKRSAS